MEKNFDCKNVVGASFSELNEDEMLEIVGGTSEDAKITPLSAVSAWFCVSVVTGVLSFRHC